MSRQLRPPLSSHSLFCLPGGQPEVIVGKTSRFGADSGKLPALVTFVQVVVVDATGTPVAFCKVIYVELVETFRLRARTGRGWLCVLIFFGSKRNEWPQKMSDLKTFKESKSQRPILHVALLLIFSLTSRPQAFF